MQIHKELQARGLVQKQEHTMRVLVPRQEMTGADRSWAQRYQSDDILRYSRTSRETGIGKGEYVRVIVVNDQENLLTVIRRNGERTTYDPRRQMGVSVYRAQERAFAVGDRVQFTTPNQEMKVANRELGSIESIAPNGSMRLKLDSGRSVDIALRSFPHLEPRLCPHQSFKPRTDCGARADPCRYQAWCKGPVESPHGLCLGLARSMGCAHLHEQQRKASAGVESRCFAQERIPAGTGDLFSDAEDWPGIGACAGARHRVRIGFVSTAKFLTEERRECRQSITDTRSHQRESPFRPRRSCWSAGKKRRSCFRSVSADWIT